MASSAAPTSSAPKQFVPYFPTGGRACKILGRGNGSASGCMFAPRLQPKDGIRLRTSCSSSRSRVTCMSSDPKGAAAMVTTDSWDKSILGCECPVLVEFYASWCGPCRMVHKVMDEIAWEYDGKIKCYLLNTDQDLQIARDYDVKAVPVVMVFKGGEKRESVIGTMPKSFYEAAIRRAMDS